MTTIFRSKIDLDNCLLYNILTYIFIKYFPLHILFKAKGWKPSWLFFFSNNKKNSNREKQNKILDFFTQFSKYWKNRFIACLRKIKPCILCLYL